MSADASTVTIPANQLESMLSRIEQLETKLENLTNAFHRLLGDDDQAYYWTPKWQQMEAIADENRKKGNYETFEDGEALVEHIQALINEPATS